ncbi:MAG: DUF4270 domain-containing protein [Muribaculaceae bacterium]|nr:DUF4270 domain-containing protein [Muribaculaceae bacterium]
MKIFRNISAILLAAIAMTACDDTTSSIGSSLITEDTQIIIDSTFVVTGRSTLNPVVQSRTLTQLIGKFDAKEFGSISSDIVCQFMPSLTLETEGVTVEDVDSAKLIMFMLPGDFTGDSLVPMGMNVFRLNKALPSPIYSNFNPGDYYDPTPIGSAIYTGHAMHNDSINSLNFRSVTVDLPRSLGQELFEGFEKNPDVFSSPSEFAKFFPGLYIANSFGSGRIMNITETRINLYYRQHAKVTVDNVEKDTIYNKVRSYFAVTPEVITNNNIDLSISPELTTLAQTGAPLIVAPAGMEVTLQMPTPDLIQTYRKGAGSLSVLNTLTLSIPAEEIANDYGIDPPEQVLLVLANEKDKFFAENKITDNKTSFIATYNSTTKTYDFSEMRGYLAEMLEKETVAADDYTFVLTAVNVETESSSNSYYQTSVSYVTTISPYVTKPAMVRLKLEDAKIKLTYTRQYANN